MRSGSCAAAASMERVSDRSHSTKGVLPDGSCLYTTITASPAALNAVTIADPMPDDPPVTTTVREAIWFSL